MDLLIADTFTDSLTRLTGEEQKVVKATAFDLQMNPVAPTGFAYCSPNEQAERCRQKGCSDSAMSGGNRETGVSHGRQVSL